MNPKIKNLTGQKIRFFCKRRGWTQNMLAASLQKMGVPIEPLLFVLRTGPRFYLFEICRGGKFVPKAILELSWLFD